MNKLQGFYELRQAGIPAVPWRFFTENEELDSGQLWTVRVAVESGDDINLPRAVGVDAAEARRRAKEYLAQFKGRGKVIYYPYFIALKSGIMEIREKTVIIEAVRGDLWNLTGKGDREVTLIVSRDRREVSYYGNKKFLDRREIDELLRHGARIRVKYRDYIFDRSYVMAEWSYAVDAAAGGRPAGDKYLVFYELRTLN